MQKYLPTVLLILTAVLGAFSGQIQAFVSGHSGVFSVVASVVGLIVHYLPSPAQTK